MDSSWLCKRLALEDAWLLVKKGFMRSVVITQGDVEACGGMWHRCPLRRQKLC